MATPLRWVRCDGPQATPVADTQCATLQTGSDITQSALRAGQKITIENAGRFLHYESQYKVLICSYHFYAVRNLAYHLRTEHEGSSKEKSAVVKKYARYHLLKPKEVSLPPPLQAPFDLLRKPLSAYICEEEECEFITVSRDEVRKHCNRTHKWRSTKKDREHWHQVWVQTFFSSGGFQRYFTVDYEEEIGDGKAGRTKAQDTTDALQDWDNLEEEHRKELEVIDGDVAKTDHTPWTHRTGWPKHLSGCNLRHLSQASRLPDRDEQTLQRATELVDKLIEKCVRGLPTLDHEIRRWLRSAKQSEPDVRPLARLQEQNTQLRYSGYWKRFICYCLRVMNSGRRPANDAGNHTDASTNDNDVEEDGSDGSDEGDSDADEQATENATHADVFHDARRLFPWQGDQKSLAEKLWQSIEEAWPEQNQLKLLLQLSSSFIFQRVRGNTYCSGLMHFLAVLGIHQEMGRLREAHDFSFMLAGVVYCARVLAVEDILPSTERDEQGEEDDKRFLTLRSEFLADGSLSVMSKMLSLLAYSKNVCFSYVNPGSASWNDDKTVLNMQGKNIVMTRFRAMVSGILDDAERLLWQELMWSTQNNRFEMPLDEIEDDMSWSQRGASFVTNPPNGLRRTRLHMLLLTKHNERGCKLRRGDVWQARQIRRYLRIVDRFRELLLLCVHLTGGQPARGTELTNIRFRNGFLQDRNVYIVHGHVMVVTRYHKSQSQHDKPKVVPRFLPWRVGQILAVYLAYVQPFQEYLSAKMGERRGWSDYVWAGNQGAWETDRLTKLMKRETQKWLKVPLTTLEYRHTAIAIGRVFVGERFGHGYASEAGGSEEPEVDEDDPLEMSAGHTGQTGISRYGVPMDIIKHLSSRSIDTFRPLSQSWHTFLGLSSYGGRGEKREASDRLEGNVDKRVKMTGLAESPMIASRRLAARIGQQENDDSSWWFGQGTPPQPAGEQAADTLAADTLAAPTRTPAQLLQFVPFTPFTPFTAQMPFAAGMSYMVMQTPQLQSNGSRRLLDCPSSPLASTHKRRRAQTMPKLQEPSEDELTYAMQKALGRMDVSFKSEEQQEAMVAILAGDQHTPLVVVLPTGGGKSLLFTVPACLPDPGVTVVVVPFRQLINNLVDKARKIGIDSMEWHHGETKPATLVFVSADKVSEASFLGYIQRLRLKGVLRRVFVDECHLTFTASNWRPKMDKVRVVRGLQVPVILLTATLPSIREYELEASMAVQMARYVRAVTTRRKTRYIVQKCSPGKLEEIAVAVCRRMRKHVGRRKGVVYCRDREQCERMAKELGCAYYHAGAVDNEEGLQSWLEGGGLIVATSALGTGVDYPGVVFTMHVDLPYGMIDFAQESGRAGRAGEDVDSMIMVEEGRVEKVQANMRGIDDTIMGEFVTTKTCRRAVMSTYLDGVAIECEGGDGDMARCDRCSEGLTALERVYSGMAVERQAVEETLDEVADGCAACWVLEVHECSTSIARKNGREEAWAHAAMECENGRSGGSTLSKGECDAFRGWIRYEVSSHSCHKCGMSQKLCATGQRTGVRCQWPNLAIPVVRGMMVIPEGMTMLRRAGFGGERWDWKGYAKWLGQRHSQRIWGEVMSNMTAVVIEFALTRQEWVSSRIDGLVKDKSEEDDEGDEEELSKDEEESAEQRREQDRWIKARLDEAAKEKDGESKLKRFMNKLIGWEGVCRICKAARSDAEDWELEHEWRECPVFPVVRDDLKWRMEEIYGMQPGRKRSGRRRVGMNGSRRELTEEEKKRA